MNYSRAASIPAIWLGISAPLAAQTPAPADTPAKEVQPAESRLKFYGFVRHDLIFDDSRLDSAQSPLFVQSEASAAGNAANFTMHPRLTRFGIDLFGPQLAARAEARVGGRIEIDFQNGGRESRALPRYRHAYLTLAWRQTSVLVGQTWDIISPLYPAVNADTLMWAAGNLGDRRPQVRATYQTTGRGDQLDLDDNGIRDGEAPLGMRFAVPGEAWAGRNLSDVRGGIGQAINRATGEGIESRGGWIEIGGDLMPRYALFGGLTVDDPDDDDLSAGGRSRNGAWYVVHRFTAGRPFVIGADYLQWQTEYRGLPDGIDNRVNAYVIYSF